jgi:hypothetical protein
MRRVFDIDVLQCPRCGGRMSVIATIEATDVLRKNKVGSARDTLLMARALSTNLRTTTKALVR